MSQAQSWGRQADMLDLVGENIQVLKLTDAAVSPGWEEGLDVD